MLVFKNRVRVVFDGGCGPLLHSTDYSLPGSKMTHTSSGAIEFMFSMKNEQNVKCSGETRMRFVVRVAQLIEHIHEVFRIGKASVCRINKRAT
jgi:hypothetical protein